MFGILQKRLPQELRLCGITDMAEASRFLRGEYIFARNARFAKPAEFEGNAFTPLYDFELGDVLCIQEERVVSNDNTMIYKGNTLQLTPDASRLHYARSKARVHEYPGGGLAVFHDPRKLATVLLEEKDNKEKEPQDAFIALAPSSDWKNEEGEAVTPPSPGLGNHIGAQVSRQCCPILRTAQNISARS